MSHDDLVGLVMDLLERVEVLEAENASLRVENRALKARTVQLEEQLRESKRATAPFSKGKRTADPKKPGRKAGVGVFGNRREPEAGPAHEVKDFSAPLDSRECPQCAAGGVNVR